MIFVLGAILVAVTLPGTLHKLINRDWNALRISDINVMVLDICFALMPLALFLNRKPDASLMRQRLRIGDLGMEAVLKPDAALPDTSTWGILWKDVARAQFIYRRADGVGMGIRLDTVIGKPAFFSAARWVTEDATNSAIYFLDKQGQLSLAKDRLEFLRKSDLVRVLESKGLRIEDEPKHLSDTIAVILGLSLAAAIAILALLYVYWH